MHSWLEPAKEMDKTAKHYSCSIPSCFSHRITKAITEGLNGTIHISESCRRYGIKPARFCHWKNEDLNSSRGSFENQGIKPVSDSRKNMNEKMIARLKDAIDMSIERKLQLKKRAGNH